jgi:hypothetical protein
MWDFDRRQRLTLTVAMIVSLAFVGNHWLELDTPKAWSEWSGWVLMGIYLATWALPVQRLTNSALDSTAYQRLHVWLGPLILLMLLVHGAVLRAPSTALLAIGLIVLSVFGCLHPNNRRPLSVRYLKLWWITHLVLGLMVTALAIAHVLDMLAYS